MLKSLSSTIWASAADSTRALNKAVKSERPLEITATDNERSRETQREAAALSVELDLKLH